MTTNFLRTLLRAFIVLVFVPLLAFGAALRQVAVIDLPGQPGFDDLVIVRGMLVMTHSGAGSVDVFDQAKRRVVAHIDGIPGARGIIADEATNRIYVGSSNSIKVIDGNTWKLISNIDLNGTPDSLLMVAQPARIIFTDSHARTINAASPATNQAIASVALDGRPGYLAFDHSRNLIYVTLQDLKQVVVLDPGLKVVKRLNVTGSQPTGIAYDTSSGRLYVAIRYAVIALNPDTGEELSRVAAPAGVDRLWLDEASHTLLAAAGGWIFVASTAGSRLTALDEIPTQVKGYAVAYDADRKLVYLPGGSEGRSKLLILKQTGSVAPQTTQNAEAKLQ